MDFDESNRLSIQENSEALDQLFPHGPAGDDVLSELAPEGWETSGLLAVAHPSPEQLLKEATRLHDNIESLFSKKRKEPPEPAPTMSDIMESYKQTAIDARRECADIVGRCLWKVFSDNHDVIAADGRRIDLGSFRGAGSTLARWFNQSLQQDSYDYMDFYMGTVWVSDRADFSPVYRMIFRRLRKLGCDWRYSFPRIGLVRFGGADAPPDPKTPYDPEKALEREQAEAKKQQEFEQMQEGLRQSYNDSVREARTLPPPDTVQAYITIYGQRPQGWPPAEDKGTA